MTSQPPKTPAPLLQVVGTNARFAREQLGMTIDQVAHDVGITPEWLRAIESGQEEPYLDEVVRIAIAVEAPIEWLAGG